jgi:adenylate cyclase
MADDEVGTMRTLTEYREVFTEHVTGHKGRIVDTTGDSVLATFDSVVEAVQASVDIQHDLGTRNETLPGHRKMHFRIGVNLGDIIIRNDGTVYGDGVNVAARLEALAEPSGVMIAEDAYRQVRAKMATEFEDAGEHEVKNIAEPVHAFRVLLEGSGPAPEMIALPANKSLRPKFVAVMAAGLAIVIGVALWGITIRVEVPQMVKADGTPTDDPVLAMPTGPSIAVLPFSDLGGATEQDFFSDGLTEQLIAELTRFPDLFVIAHGTTAQYKGSEVGSTAIGREIGVMFVLEGSVQKSGTTIRVSARLSETEDGKQIWAETYDRSLTTGNIFEVQDEITQQVVATLAASGYGAIARADLEETRSKSTGSLDAYGCVLRAHEYHRVESEPEHLQARECLEATTRSEPDNVEAWALLARSYIDEHRYQYNVQEGASPPMDRALEAAHRAVELAPENQHAHWALSKTQFFRHEVDQFLAGAERAFALNPNNATILADLGLQMAFAGEWERGLAFTEKAMALNPRHPGWYYFPFVWFNSINGDHQAALEAARKIEMPGFHFSHLVLALAYGGLGRDAEAKASLEDLWALSPDFTIESLDAAFRIFNFREQDIAVLTDNMRKAGLPDAMPEPSRPVSLTMSVAAVLVQIRDAAVGKGVA